MFWTFVDPDRFADGRVTIDGPQGHHLARVLRVRPGELGVAVANRREYQIEVVEAQAGKVVGRVLADRPAAGEPAVAITLLQALVPNPDLDAVIENGTAVGIARFIAIEAQRSVARPGSSRLSRWQAIARSAAEQSHRGAIPDVIGPVPLTTALDLVTDSRLLVLNPGAARTLAQATDAASSYAIAVGPEGGWTKDELAMMTGRGGVDVDLGPRILRSRLAPIVATAILVQQR